MEKEDFVFGTRAVIEAINNGRPIDKVLIKTGLNNDLFQQLYHLIKENKVPFQFVPLGKINRVTRKNHQGVVALLAPTEFHNIEFLLPAIFEKGETPLLLILDEITDVRNFGAVVRTAECAGVQAIIVPEKGSARIGGDAVKTSAGAIHYVPVCRVDNLVKTIQFLQDSGIRIVAATEKAKEIYSLTEMKGPLAIILDSEEYGISEKILKIADQLVKIPVFGKIESLNISVAAALMVYEAVRQRE